MWSIAEFIESLENQQSIENKKQSVPMLVCWKAHTNRINDILYVSVNKTIVTISADESAR